MGKGAGKGGEATETMVSGNDFDAKVLAPQDEFIGKLGQS
jgi:hypothetical protein